jgi:hypothetical protein
MAISTIPTSGIADNAVTAAKIPAGAVVADVGTDGITATQIAANAVGSSEIAADAVGSSELANDAVLPANIAYLGDGTGTLSGTITGQQLRLGTAFTLTDDLTVNGDLTLSKVRADGTGQSLSQNTSANRTITGTGTLRMGHATEKTSISGFTGLLDPAVTGKSVIKAWVNFNGQGTVAIRYAYNVSSITDQGTGLSRITFSTAMNNVGYVVNGMVTRHGGVGRGANGICLKRDVAPTTGYVDIETHDQAHATSDSNFNDNQFVMIQIFGD